MLRFPAEVNSSAVINVVNHSCPVGWACFRTDKTFFIVGYLWFGSNVCLLFLFFSDYLPPVPDPGRAGRYR